MSANPFMMPMNSFAQASSILASPAQPATAFMMAQPAIPMASTIGQGPFNTAAAAHVPISFDASQIAGAAMNNNPTIEISASIGRPSIWRSLAQFVSGIARSRSRPQATVITTAGDPMGANSQQQQQFLANNFNGGGVAASNLHSAFMLDGASMIITKRSFVSPGSNKRLRLRKGASRSGPFDASRLINAHNNYYLLNNNQPQHQVPIYSTQIHPTAALMTSSSSPQAQTIDKRVDPMQRLLMLKTAQDNEVCSPISDSGSKIRYSCVPNHCVGPGKTAAETNTLFSNHVNSNNVYKPSGSSMSQDRRKRPAPNVIYQNTDSNNLDTSGEQLNGVHFDERQPIPPPSIHVTYDHLNAYQAPDISRFLQPNGNHMNQQFGGSPQNLRNYLNNSYTEMSDLYEDNHQSNPFEDNPQHLNHFANNPNQQQPFASFPQQYQQSHPTSHLWHNNGTSNNTITYGTAYVPTTLRPGNNRTSNSDHDEPTVHQQPYRLPILQQQYNPKSDDEPAGQQFGRNFSPGPNEFVSAVDEQLERPIPVAALDQPTPRPRKSAKNRARLLNSTISTIPTTSTTAGPFLSQQWPRIPAPSSKQRRRNTQSEWTLRPGAIPATQQTASNMPQQPSLKNSSEDDDDETGEPLGLPGVPMGSQDDDYDEEEPHISTNNYTNYHHHNSNQQQQPLTSTTSQQQLAQRRGKPTLMSNVSLDGGNGDSVLYNRQQQQQPEAAVLRERKTRRNASTTSLPPTNNINNYYPNETKQIYQQQQNGLRHNYHAALSTTRQPPPPEKGLDDAGVYQTLYGGHDSDDNSLVHVQQLANNSSDCNCPTSTSQPVAVDAAKQLPRSGQLTELDPDERILGRQQPQNNLMWAAKRKQHQDESSSSSGQQQQTNTNLFPKDRRQITDHNYNTNNNYNTTTSTTSTTTPPTTTTTSSTIPTTTSSSSAKRPYSLRNTRYKNLHPQSAANSISAAHANQNQQNNSQNNSSLGFDSKLMIRPQMSANMAGNFTHSLPTLGDHEMNVGGGGDISTTRASTSTNGAADKQASILSRNRLSVGLINNQTPNLETGNPLTQFDDDPNLNTQPNQTMSAGYNNDNNNGDNDTNLDHESDDDDDSVDEPEVNGDEQTRHINNINNNHLVGAERDITVAFRPHSVNDIVAKARQEQELRNISTLLVGGSAQTSTRRLGRHKQAEQLERAKPIHELYKLDGDYESDNENNDHDHDHDDNHHVTPHQYQIQLRWNNNKPQQSQQDQPKQQARFDSPSASSNNPQSKSKSGKMGKGVAEMDKLREHVRDRLFEHREEEHWHERERVKGRLRGPRLRDGRWVVDPNDHFAPRALANSSRINYGPSANERLTPIKNQLSDWPSQEETRSHFAIPTRNFRQSREFVDWVQKQVDLDGELEPPSDIKNFRPSEDKQQTINNVIRLGKMSQMIGSDREKQRR